MTWWKTQTAPPTKSYVLEVEKPLAPVETKDSITEVMSLQGHPGFQWLLRKLNFQAARMKAELAQRHHTELRDVDNLQNGIYWCQWLQSQLDLTNEKFKSMRDLSSTESKFFEQISSQIQLIGAPQNSDNQ